MAEEQEQVIETVQDAPAVETETPPEAPPEKPEVDATKYVPLHTLQETRKEKLQLKRELDEQRRLLEVANHRVEQLFHRFSAPEQPKAPDVQTDPVGAIAHETKMTRQEFDAFRRETFAEKQQAQQEAQFRQFIGTAQAQAQVFAQKTPDWPQAYTYLLSNFREELTEAGYTPQEVESLAGQYEASTIARAMQDGVNPGERLYALAKRRGYKPQTQQNAESKVEAIAKGTAAAKSLSNVGGSAPKNLTAEVIANMSMEEFEKLTPAQFRAAFGG